jgi:hypothetical protein
MPELKQKKVRHGINVSRLENSLFGKRFMNRQLIILLLLFCYAFSANAVVFREDREESRKKYEEKMRLKRELQAADTLGIPGPLGLFGRSLLIPGWGQKVAAGYDPEYEGSGKLALYVDLGLAAITWGLIKYAGIKRSEYQTYAAEVAGVGYHSDNSDFWVDIANYDSRDDFNRSALENGNLYGQYTSQGDHWMWPVERQRGRYIDLRAASEDAYSAALAAGGTIILNHVLSAVHAMRIGSKLRDVRLKELKGGGLGASLSFGFDLAKLNK